MVTKKELVSYSTDASRIKGIAERVVFPKDVREVEDIIKTPATDIVPRGAGSGLVGGVVPNNSVVVDMTKMNKVLEFNSGKRVVKVEAGITIRELNEKLSSRGYEFPIDVYNQGISTIGGMIATNSTGDRSMKYGTMKDWVDGVEYIDGKGEFIKATKADIGEVCGMEGITGIIVSAKLRVIPLVKRSISVYQSDNIDEVLSVARRLKAEKEVIKLKLFSKYTSKLLGLPEKYNLIIEFDSEKRGKVTGAEYEKVLNLEKRAYYGLASEGYYNMEDPKFFFDKIREFLNFLEASDIPYIGNLGSGIIHPFFRDDEKSKRERVVDFIRTSQGKPGKFGIGIVRKYFVDPFDMTIIQRVKLRHDPYARMNRGKLIGEMSSGKRYSMTPGVKEKIMEIKPSPLEEKSARELVKNTVEISTPKSNGFENSDSPEEKMHAFIKEVSKENITETKKEEFYKPEVKETVKTDPIEERPRPKSSVDYNLINKIMNNKYNPSDKQGLSKEPPASIDKKTENRFSDNSNKPRTSESDRDAINKIMTNRFGKGFSNNNSNKEGRSND
ncbi:D-lactate dehydrogenase (acceptor) [uncultured archaeon]|nr:D-lactate dehydrogenase (acceptor) [uncultured archaeon]